MSRPARGGAETPRGTCEMSSSSPHETVTTAERGREFWRSVLLAGGFTALPRWTLAARGETPAAFGRRSSPLHPTALENARRGPRADCVAPPSNIPDIAPHRAQDARWGPRSAVVAPLRRGPHGADCAPWGGSAGRLAALGATLDFHHGLLMSGILLSWSIVLAEIL